MAERGEYWLCRKGLRTRLVGQGFHPLSLSHFLGPNILPLLLLSQQLGLLGHQI